MRRASGSVSMRTFSLRTKVGVAFPFVTTCVLAGILVLSQKIIESRILFPGRLADVRRQ
jgi:hypothetical protein